MGRVVGVRMREEERLGILIRSLGVGFVIPKIIVDASLLCQFFNSDVYQGEPTGGCRHYLYKRSLNILVYSVS